MRNLLLSLFALTVFTACNSDKKDNLNTLSPDGQKQKMSEITSSLANAIDMKDMAPLQTAIQSLESLLGESPLMSPQAPNAQQSTLQITQTLKGAIQQLSLNKIPSTNPLTKAAIQASDYFVKFTYNATSKQFEQSQAIDGFYLIYPSNGVLTTISCKPSTQYNQLTIEGLEINIPKQITLKIEQNQNIIASVSIAIENLSFNQDNIQDKSNALKSEVVITLCNYGVSLITDITSARSSIETAMFKNDECLLIFAALGLESTPNANMFAGNVGNVECLFAIMNSLFIGVQTDNLTKTINDTNNAKTNTEIADAFNKNIKAWGNFDNSKEKAFRIESQASTNEVYPVMVFSDGSKYRLEEYFTQGFDSTIEAFANLASQIENTLR